MESPQATTPYYSILNKNTSSSCTIADCVAGIHQNIQNIKIIIIYVVSDGVGNLKTVKYLITLL